MDLRTETTVTDPRSRKWTIERLKTARESEDRVEFKRGEGGNVAYDGGNRTKPGERRRCILGYVVALCNEGGGTIVIGMHDKWPHEVVGTRQCENGIGQLESDVYKDVGIRPYVYELFENERGKTGRVLVMEVPGRPVVHGCSVRFCGWGLKNSIAGNVQIRVVKMSLAKGMEPC